MVSRAKREIAAGRSGFNSQYPEKNMIVVDVETSGVDPYKNSLLSVGALDFDNPENQFYEECRVWDGAHVEDEALEINGFTREEVTNPRKKSDREVVEDFLRWVESCEEHTIAGQNPSFDRDFLRITAYRYHLNWPLADRTIDLHSVAYYHMIRQGTPPPRENKRSDLNLAKILKYVGLNIERGKHNALEDTRLEAEVFSRLFYGRPLFSEFEKFKIPCPLQ